MAIPDSVVSAAIRASLGTLAQVLADIAVSVVTRADPAILDQAYQATRASVEFRAILALE